MKRNWKKRWPAVALTLASLTSVVSAVDDMQMRNLENRVSALEQRRGANGMINPAARPVVRDGINLWFQGEALYMQAQEDGLYYAVQTRTADSGGRVRNSRYEWDWGFRFGAGYNIPHDGWDMLLNWTWFRTDGGRRTLPRKGFAINPSLINSTVADAQTPGFNRAEGDANLHYATLDYENGREFFVSKWLTLRPFVGARAGWFKRGLQWSATNTSFKDFGRHTTKFSGGGLHAGLNTQWGFGMGWSLYGDLALNLLYGTHRIHQKGTGTTLGYIEKTHDSWLINRPMLDMALGIRWDRLICNDAYRVRLQFGWEQHILWGFGKQINYVASNEQGKYTFNHGDLTLSGFAFQGRFDF